MAWKTRSATSLTRCSSPAWPGSSPASTTSADSSTILAPIFATPPFIKLATYDFPAWGRALRSAITSIKADMIECSAMKSLPVASVDGPASRFDPTNRDHWREPVVQMGEARSLGRKADPVLAQVGLMPELGGCARLNQP